MEISKLKTLATPNLNDVLPILDVNGGMSGKPILRKATLSSLLALVESNRNSGLEVHAFHHIAITRSKGVVSFYTDYALQGTTQFTGVIPYGQGIAIGRNGLDSSGGSDQTSFKGNLKNLRITKACREIANFIH